MNRHGSPAVLNFSQYSGVAPASWQIRSANASMRFNDSLFSRTNAIILPFSVINQLNYLQLNVLKRFCEAGGGVVAIRDTVIMQPDCKWINEWNNSIENVEGDHNNSNVMVVSGNANQTDIASALTYVTRDNDINDYSRVATLPVPDSSHFIRQVLTADLDEPMQMVLLPGNDVLIAERKGQVKLFRDREKTLTTIENIRVFSGIEDGLLGICADPDFGENNFLYLFYSVPGDTAVNRLSRIRFLNGKLQRSSEKVLMDIPTQRKYCCHSAGYLCFDSGGNLYITTGDNTNAEETDGYTPVDERPGRKLSDDQATAANSNDLRGKILRIKPEPDGSYSIPDGNLFPKDGSQGRPEIFVMGCRNPFRVSIDPKRGYVYWGDVGPDTKVNGKDGLLSFDEINQAKFAGFFGWPYFLADNQAIPLYDYALKKTRGVKDPLKPLNTSPNNSGIQQLPPAQPAMVWYNKGSSKRFPLTGKGGASAMTGPVYYRDLFKNAKFRLPAYYDGKLFVFDWVRRWFRAISFDENGNYSYMEPFLDEFAFAAPIDMRFSPDGSIYVLEYGSNGFMKNPDAKLSRIEYYEDAPPPKAEIMSASLQGGIPFAVRMSAKPVVGAFDGGKYEYSWQVEGKTFRGTGLSYTFRKAGIYDVVLTVSNNQGQQTTDRRTVYVGNAPPSVKIQTNDNRTFYFDNQTFDFDVLVSDPEAAVDPAALEVQSGFIPHGNDVAVVLAGEQRIPGLQLLAGEKLLRSSDCMSCHTFYESSIGPAFLSIASKYEKDGKARKKLADKVIMGGSGNWGERAMPAHMDLQRQTVDSMVAFILSLNKKNHSKNLANSLVFDAHNASTPDGVYLISAGYLDKGANGMPAVYSRDHVLLRRPVLQAEAFDEGNVHINTITTLFFSYINGIVDKKYIGFHDIDLTGIRKVRYRLQTAGKGGVIEIRINSVNGPLISSITVPAGNDTDPKKGWKMVSGDVAPTAGIHSVYFVFCDRNAGDQQLFTLDEISFDVTP